MTLQILLPSPVWQASPGIRDMSCESARKTDFFSYTENAQVETATLTARWNRKWSSSFGASPYYLFGENAGKGWADGVYRFHENNWVRVLGAAANPQDVVPESEALIEYGHGFRFSNHFSKDWKALIRNIICGIAERRSTRSTRLKSFICPGSGRGRCQSQERTHGSPTGESDWVPSGSTRAGFPLASKALRKFAVRSGRGKFRASRSDRPPVGPHLRRRPAIPFRRKSGRDRLCRHTRSRIRAETNQPGIELWDPILAGFATWAWPGWWPGQFCFLCSEFCCWSRFIVFRRWYRGRYFARLNTRTVALREQWADILSGKVPGSAWRLNALDCQIVEDILLDNIEVSGNDQLPAFLACLRNSGLLDLRIREARSTEGWSRRSALLNLGRTRAPEAVPALAEALASPSEETRVAAVRGLGSHFVCPRPLCPFSNFSFLS
jgi:hypothetical protein